ncbi:flagellar biosynthesis protein FlhA [Rhizomicrobium electricum]|jgi:flagellar biosynthesis protein FlhA|uniref:Flagellar biosynthesis protein FlhA n=1 Tax=Rhizomicrobium electricum TaxID=480070 RepID=A0ABN1EWB2_9PROT|nr:flagellar biosynthesis protein FlhA [Rhizomicrobium electricum]NIJ49547.1 flagellar biosynthesis protein FlhA [Rhizomicrobium electricum]
MADTSAATPSLTSAINLTPAGILDFIKRSDLMLAIGIMAILVTLILPLPTVLLDFALALSLSFAILILMTAVFIRRPLEFSSFPAVLLITTMLRLSLNLASTRLILAHGNTGTTAAGHVIEAFGKLIMQGNFVIGFIVFAILVIVNFVVITKGSGRIAEVAARFTLDAMPGKQMAIDADLSAGLIDDKEARRRRKDLESESNFFGAMDGASKFVRGDAIAGLLIVGINVIGGIIVAVVQHGMSFGDATKTFTLLSVGEGLVAQLPALIISIAAGLMVSKAGIEGSTDRAMAKQFSNYPQGLAMASAVMGIVALLPGMPHIIFALLSGGVGYLSTKAFKHKAAEEALERREEEQIKVAETTKEEPISAALALDMLRVELGYALLTLINDVKGHRITDQIKALRRQLAQEMGFVMPAVRILDNMQLGANEYRIAVKEVESGRGELYPGSLLAMDPRGLPIDLPGTHTTEPAFGLPATWVASSLREEASFRGYTVVDPGTVLTTHLTEVLKTHMAELLSYAETKKLLDELPAEHKKLVEELIPSQISVTGVQRVLQTLLGERVSIRDLPAILEGIAEAVGHTKNALYITEHVRARLARQICNANMSPNGYLPLIAMSPAWEQAFAESIIGQGEDRQLAMAPSQLQQFITQVRDRFEEGTAKGDVPVLLTSPQARPFVRSIIERFRAQTVVMSQNEIHPSIRLRTLGQV